MKRTILLAGASLLVGCASPIQHLPQEIEVRGIDFRPHTADGFYLSTDPFTAAHEPIGEVYVIVRAEGRREFDKRTGFDEMMFRPLSIDSAVAVAKARTRALGGDALVNIRITNESEPWGVSRTRPGLSVSGLAIRRR